MEINSIILSAGKGTRMQSDLPKVVQKVAGYEMINMVLKTMTDAGIRNNCLVLGYKKDDVIKRIDPKYQYDFVVQEEQLGTGHAVLMAKEKLAKNKGVTIVACGDTPLITVKTVQKLVKKHTNSRNDLTILTATLENPSGYGRIVRNDVDNVIAIVEEKEADRNTKAIKEINTGIYCFDNEKLFKYIEFIDDKNEQEEFYLTDLIKIFNDNNERVSGYITPVSQEVVGVNDLTALVYASKVLHERINLEHLSNGVNIIDPSNTYIGPNVVIGKESIVEPNNKIMGNTKIGKKCLIASNNNIMNSIIGDEVVIKSGNTITESHIGNYTTVGPMAHLREEARIGEYCRIGNFVEIKKSTLGNKVAAAHLTYLGNSIVGNNVNFGCGVITANYDGINKYETVIGNDVFVGSNTNLIAPINIEDGVMIAAGTTVTSDIDREKFVISRVEQKIKDRVR
ncbi:MAG: bifunctional UDP-N-acetylglucosamine diphosphorylase/glucosamine-1-phosphate N-acetyltransferase GlmU [Mycoplasmatales bacterium]